jgi:hypothetical protein
MIPTFKATGGAGAGGINATWPLAKLEASADSLRVSILTLGIYSFTPGTVVSITRYTRFPIFGWGIQIQHCVPDYLARLIFWCLGNPVTLLAGIRDSGFQPEAPASAIPPRRGLALRWSAIVIAAALWNGFFLLDMLWQHRTSPMPGGFSLLAISLVLASCIATIQAPAFRQLVLKPGRSIGEIRPILNLLLLVSGSIFVVLSLMAITA